MRPRFICSMVLRLMGVYICCISLPEALGYTHTVITRTVQQFPQRGPIALSVVMWENFPYHTTGITLPFGLYFLFGGRRLVNLIMRSARALTRDSCLNCGYDLRGLQQSSCPECHLERDKPRV